VVARTGGLAEALWLEQNALWPLATRRSEAPPRQRMPVGQKP
jgi:hypothetical protein